MIIHCFNIFSICRAICKGESLSDKNADYLLAGTAEMIIFDFALCVALFG